MKRLKDNLVIQFLAIFFAVMTILAVVILLILTPQLTETVDQLDEHYAATVAGINVSPAASFSIPRIKEDILDLRSNTYFASGGGFSILYLSLILVVLRGWSTIEKQRGELMAQAAQSAREDELRNSRQRIVAAQESVRRDIAQQLHGSVQNRLIMLILRLKELEDADQSVDVSEGIKDLRLRFEELLDKEIRSISHQLYPMILRRGLIPALQSLGDQFENVFPIQLELEAGLQQRERSDHNLIPEQVRLAAYRTAEEALTNAMKHAQASAVTITVGSPDEGWLGIAVHDDGEGFEPDSIGDGLGLVGMRDYVEVAGGDFKIKSSPANGTEVSACLPLSGLGSESPEKAAS